MMGVLPRCFDALRPSPDPFLPLTLVCAAVVLQLGGLAWDRWNHVVFVVNGITGSVSTYVNGEFVSKVGGGGPTTQAAGGGGGGGLQTPSVLRSCTPRG